MQEWRHQLRSSLHPILFAGVYRFCALLCQCFNIEPVSEASILLAGPKVVQALSAAVLDFFTWRLAQRIFGSTSRVAWTAVRLCSIPIPICTTTSQADIGSSQLSSLQSVLQAHGSGSAPHGRCRTLLKPPLRRLPCITGPGPGSCRNAMMS